MIETVVHDGVAVVTICRPEKANSLPQEGKAALATEIDRLSSDADTRAVVLTGAGERFFSAGSDIAQMKSFGPIEMDGALQAERSMYLAALTSPKPVVAAVNGFALGAGFVLAMCCDYSVASTEASFGMPELTIGAPAPLESFLLPQVIGLSRARDVFFTGRRFTATEAVRIGFVNETVEHGHVVERAQEVAGQFAQLPADAFRIQKGLLYRLIATGDTEGVIRESQWLTAKQFGKGEVAAAMEHFLGRSRG